MPSNSYDKVIEALAKQVVIDRQRYAQKDLPLHLFERMFSRPLNEIEADPKHPALEKIKSIVGKKKRNQTYNKIYSFIKNEFLKEENQKGWRALQKGFSHKIQYIDFLKENFNLFGYKLAALATAVSIVAIAIDFLFSAVAHALSASIFILIAPTLPYLVLGIMIAAVAVVGSLLLISAAEFFAYKWHEKKEEFVEDFPNALDLGL